MSERALDAVTIAEAVAIEIAPNADEANRLGKINPADITVLTSSGYTALSVPQEYGGYGASLRDCVAAQIELAEANPSTALIAGMNMHVIGHQRETRSWFEGKFAQYCDDVVNHQGLLNSIATEPALGSPSRGQIFKTVACSEDGGYRINGLKTWSTGGEYLTHMLVKLSIDADQTGIIRVPQDAAGVRWEYTWSDVLSLRASESHDVYFEDVWVSAENLVSIDQGKAKANVWFPLVMSAIYHGAAVGARNTVIAYALERVPTALGRPIATLPKIQRQIGEIDMRLQAAQALLFEVAGEWRGDDADRDAIRARLAAAKEMVTWTARYATDLALQIAGGISLTNSLPLERYFRDVRAGSMQPPSGDTALELIGRTALDL